jgi:hypothetical protein
MDKRDVEIFLGWEDILSFNRVECDKGKKGQVLYSSRVIITLKSQTVAVLFSCKNLAQPPT